MLAPITVTGYEGVKAKLAAVVGAIDVEGILDEITAALLARTRVRFLQQVDPDGVPWVPSFASIRRARAGRGGGTLFDTGRLFHSIQAFMIDENTRSIGTDVEYAPKHQFGLDGMLKRVFLGFGQDDYTIAQKITQNRIDKIKQALA